MQGPERIGEAFELDQRQEAIIHLRMTRGKRQEELDRDSLQSFMWEAKSVDDKTDAVGWHLVVMAGTGSAPWTWPPRTSLAPAH